MSVNALRRSSTRRPNIAADAPKAPMPGFVEPCDPTLQGRAPTGEGWVYEIKTDGYRAQVHVRNRHVRNRGATVYSRSGYDWTEQFAPIAKAASKLKVREAIIDGEATVLGDTGLSDFQALRRELRNRESTKLLLHAFDLLYLNGHDLRRTPLLERKHALKRLLQGAPSNLVYVV
jgi:bifunctional non-homologous end joining protein LigD